MAGINRKVRYYLEDSADGVFEIAPESGLVRLSGSLDRESVPSYVLKVRASDQGAPQLSRDTLLHINVLDVNDNPPQVDIRDSLLAKNMFQKVQEHRNMCVIKYNFLNISFLLITYQRSNG